MASVKAAQEIAHKTTSEDPSDLTFEFKALLASGETISSVVSILSSDPGSGPLTVGANNIVTTQVRTSVTGGVAPNRYEVTCLIQTSTGQRIELVGTVIVED